MTNYPQEPGDPRSKEGVMRMKRAATVAFVVAALTACGDSAPPADPCADEVDRINALVRESDELVEQVNDAGGLMSADPELVAEYEVVTDELTAAQHAWTACDSRRRRKN